MTLSFSYNLKKIYTRGNFIVLFFFTRRVSKVIFIDGGKPAPDRISIKLLKVNNLLDSTTTAIMFSRQNDADSSVRTIQY